MKALKKIICFGFICGSSFMVANAQQNTGEVAINASVGYSPLFDGNIVWISAPIYPIPNEGFEEYWNVASATPYFGIAADFGLVKWFSAGLAAGYQSETVNDQAFYYNDHITRTNFGARFLFHLNPSNPNLDLSMGLRASFSDYYDNPTSYGNPGGYPPDGPIYFIKKPNQVVFNFQVILLACRVYFNDILGIHAELALGSPYFLDAGLTFRINHKKANLQPSAPASTK